MGEARVGAKLGREADEQLLSFPSSESSDEVESWGKSPPRLAEFLRRDAVVACPDQSRRKDNSGRAVCEGEGERRVVVFVGDGVEGGGLQCTGLFSHIEDNP